MLLPGPKDGRLKYTFVSVVLSIASKIDLKESMVLLH